MQDVWHPGYAGAPGDGSAWMDEGETARHVVRGGAWDYLPRLLRSAWRDALDAGCRRDNVGFASPRPTLANDGTPAIQNALGKQWLPLPSNRPGASPRLPRRRRPSAGDERRAARLSIATRCRRDGFHRGNLHCRRLRARPRRDANRASGILSPASRDRARVPSALHHRDRRVRCVELRGECRLLRLGPRDGGRPAGARLLRDTPQSLAFPSVDHERHPARASRASADLRLLALVLCLRTPPRYRARGHRTLRGARGAHPRPRRLRSRAAGARTPLLRNIAPRSRRTNAGGRPSGARKRPAANARAP